MAKQAAKKAKRGASRKNSALSASSSGAPAKVQKKGSFGLILGLVFLAVLAGVVFEIVYITKKKVAEKIEFVDEAPLVAKGQADGQCWGARSIAVGPSGAWYFLDGENPHWRLQKFNADMSYGGKYVPKSKEEILQNAYGLACDEKGNVYVLQENGLIRVLDPSLKFMRAIDTKTAAAHALDLDSKGNIYVLGTGDQVVNVYSNDGKQISSFGKPGSGKNALASPIRIFIDTKDNVYVLETLAESMRVKVFTTQGQLQRNFVVDLMPTMYSSFGVDSEGRFYFSDLVQEQGVRVYSASGDYLGSSKSSTDGQMFPGQGHLAVNKRNISVILAYAGAIGKFHYAPKR